MWQRAQHIISAVNSISIPYTPTQKPSTPKEKLIYKYDIFRLSRKILAIKPAKHLIVCLRQKNVAVTTENRAFECTTLDFATSKLPAFEHNLPVFSGEFVIFGEAKARPTHTKSALHAAPNTARREQKIRKRVRIKIFRNVVATHKNHKTANHSAVGRGS